jgi:hypothetical protein
MNLVERVISRTKTSKPLAYDLRFLRMITLTALGVCFEQPDGG